MLEFVGVGKDYAGLLRSATAVDGFTLSMQPGDVLGLIGPNGSGKTTLIHLALGFLWPTRGRVAALGVPAGDVRVRSRIGWVPDQAIYPRQATGRAHLLDWLAGHGWTAAASRERADALLERFGLAAAATRRIHTYSLGMQQKLALILALSHEPDLLILDEPFSALDHRTNLELRELLRELGRQGRAVLVSSHHLPELEDVSTRAVFLRRGRIEREERLDPESAPLTVDCTVLDPERARALLQGEPPGYLDGWSIEGRILSARVTDPARVPDLVAWLAGRDVPIVGISTHRRSLEAIYLGLERGA